MTYNFMIDLFLGLVEPLFPYTFDPLLQPLLSVGSAHTGAMLTVAVVSIGLSGMLMILKYFLMDMDKHEEVKERRKELNKKMKQAQEDGDTEKTSEHMQEMMALQKDMFASQMKPMLVSMLVFFVVLPWMYTTFTPVVGLAAADGGTYTGDLQFNGYTQELTIENRTGTEPVVIVDGEERQVGETLQIDDLSWRIRDITLTEETQSVRLAAIVLNLPFGLPLVGDTLGWFGTYFLFVLPFSMIFGKLLGIQ